VRFRRDQQPAHDQQPVPSGEQPDDSDGGILGLLAAHAPAEPESLLGAQAAAEARFRVSSPEGYQETQVDAFCQDVVDTLTYYEHLVSDLHEQVERLTKQNTELRMTVEVFRVYGRPVVDEESGEYVTEQDAQQAAQQTATPTAMQQGIPAQPTPLPAAAQPTSAVPAGLGAVLAAGRPTPTEAGNTQALPEPDRANQTMTEADPAPELPTVQHLPAPPTTLPAGVAAPVAVPAQPAALLDDTAPLDDSSVFGAIEDPFADATAGRP
jgi:cell division septum initiation protein DivIVA